MAQSIAHWKQLNRDVSRFLLGETRKKFRTARENPKVLAKLFLEALVSVAIAAGLFFFLDPSIDLIPVPWNFALFALGIGILLYIKYLLP